MADEYSVRDLVARAHTHSPEHFASLLGPFVLIGPRTKQDDAEPGWSYATRHGRGAMPENPFATLLDSVAYGISKREAGAAFADTILIGRAASNDVVIEDTSISKLHARITVDGYVLSDADSTNGTFVGDERLVAGKTVPLRANLDLKFGERRFRVYEVEGLHRVLSRLEA